MTYDELEIRLAAWAQSQPSVRAVIATGSRARADNPADRWSDLDVHIFTTDPAAFAADPSWLQALGDAWIAYLETTPASDQEWFVVFDEGLKLDAVLMPITDASLDLDTILKPFANWDATRRGVRVLFDRLGAPRYIAPMPFTPPPPPTAAEFDHAVSGFLMAAVTIAKFIGRGDFYRAQRWFAADLQPHLLRIVEWRAYGQDVWYGGRFMEQWADPRFLAALPDTFATFERASLTRALLTMLDLLRVLGGEVAARFSFAYPAAAHERAAAIIDSLIGDAAT